MALPKQHRLRRRKEFNAVYQKGIRRSSDCLTLRALRRLPLRNAPQDRLCSAIDKVPAKPSRPLVRGDRASGESLLPSQFGVSISLKVSKKAVIRNRLRRQIQAALQVLLPRIMPGWQIAIIVHPSAIECNYGKILQQLEHLFTELTCLR